MRHDEISGKRFTEPAEGEFAMCTRSKGAEVLNGGLAHMVQRHCPLVPMVLLRSQGPSHVPVPVAFAAEAAAS